MTLVLLHPSHELSEHELWSEARLITSHLGVDFRAQPTANGGLTPRLRILYTLASP